MQEVYLEVFCSFSKVLAQVTNNIIQLPAENNGRKYKQASHEVWGSDGLKMPIHTTFSAGDFDSYK